ILLDGAVSQPEKRLSELPLLSEPEREQLLVEWNRTASIYPSELIHELFERQAESRPEAIALIDGERWLSYGELNRRANQLANYLRHLGVEPEVVVGICIKRSAEMIVGLLGILKAGGVYLPLDPTYPLERLSLMIEDASISVLLTHEYQLRALP